MNQHRDLPTLTDEIVVIDGESEIEAGRGTTFFWGNPIFLEAA